MPQIRPVLQGPVKFRDGKKWRRKYCVITQSPFNRAFHFYCFKSYDDFAPYLNPANVVLSEDLLKQTFSDDAEIKTISKDPYPLANEAVQTAVKRTMQGLSMANKIASTISAPGPIDEITGLERGLHLDNEGNIILLVGTKNTYAISLSNEDDMFLWADTMGKRLDDDHFHVSLVQTSGKNKLSLGLQAIMHIQTWRVCLISEPSAGAKFIGNWRLDTIESLKTIAPKPGSDFAHLVLEANASAGKLVGLYRFQINHKKMTEMTKCIEQLLSRRFLAYSEALEASVMGETSDSTSTKCPQQNMFKACNKSNNYSTFDSGIAEMQHPQSIQSKFITNDKTSFVIRQRPSINEVKNNFALDHRISSVPSKTPSVFLDIKSKGKKSSIPSSADSNSISGQSKSGQTCGNNNNTLPPFPQNAHQLQTSSLHSKIFPHHSNHNTLNSRHERRDSFDASTDTNGGKSAIRVFAGLITSNEHCSTTRDMSQSQHSVGNPETFPAVKTNPIRMIPSNSSRKAASQEGKNKSFDHFPDTLPHRTRQDHDEFSSVKSDDQMHSSIPQTRSSLESSRGLHKRLAYLFHRLNLGTSQKSQKNEEKRKSFNQYLVEKFHTSRPFLPAPLPPCSVPPIQSHSSQARLKRFSDLNESLGLSNLSERRMTPQRTQSSLSTQSMNERRKTILLSRLIRQAKEEHNSTSNFADNLKRFLSLMNGPFNKNGEQQKEDSHSLINEVPLAKYPVYRYNTIHPRWLIRASCLHMNEQPLVSTDERNEKKNQLLPLCENHGFTFQPTASQQQQQQKSIRNIHHRRRTSTLGTCMSLDIANNCSLENSPNIFQSCSVDLKTSHQLPSFNRISHSSRLSINTQQFAGSCWSICSQPSSCPNFETTLNKYPNERHYYLNYFNRNSLEFIPRQTSKDYSVDSSHYASPNASLGRNDSQKDPNTSFTSTNSLNIGPLSASSMSNASLGSVDDIRQSSNQSQDFPKYCNVMIMQNSTSTTNPQVQTNNSTLTSATRFLMNLKIESDDAKDDSLVHTGHSDQSMANKGPHKPCQTNEVPDEIRDPKINYACVDLRPSPSNSAKPNIKIRIACSPMATEEEGGRTASDQELELNSSKKAEHQDYVDVTAIANDQSDVMERSSSQTLPGYRRHSHSLSSVLPQPKLNYAQLVQIDNPAPSQESTASASDSMKLLREEPITRNLMEHGANGSLTRDSSPLIYTEIDYTRTRVMEELNTRKSDSVPSRNMGAQQRRTIGRSLKQILTKNDLFIPKNP